MGLEFGGFSPQNDRERAELLCRQLWGQSEDISGVFWGIGNRQSAPPDPSETNAIECSPRRGGGSVSTCGAKREPRARAAEVDGGASCSGCTGLRGISRIRVCM